MLVSEKLWNKLTEDNSSFNQWTTWLNKYGVNGTLVDLDDNTSAINPEKSKALKIMFEPESNSTIEVWFDKFGDDEIGYIDVLNVVFNDLETALEPLKLTISEWLVS